MSFKWVTEDKMYSEKVTKVSVIWNYKMWVIWQNGKIMKHTWDKVDIEKLVWEIWKKQMCWRIWGK